MKKRKIFRFISAFMLAFVVALNVGFYRQQEKEAKAILPLLALTPEAISLLVAATPYVIEGLMAAGCAVHAYYSTKSLSVDIYNERVKVLAGKLTQDEINKVNEEGKKYADAGGSYTVSSESIPDSVYRKYVQQMCLEAQIREHKELQYSPGQLQLEPTIDKLGIALDALEQQYTNNTLTYIKATYPNVAYSFNCVRTDGNTYIKKSSYENQYYFSTTVVSPDYTYSYYRCSHTVVSATFTNTLTGQSTSCVFNTIVTSSINYQDEIYFCTLPNALTSYYPVNASLPGTTNQKELSNVLGLGVVAGGDFLAKVLAVAGQGNFVYSPSIVDESAKNKDIAVSDTMTLPAEQDIEKKKVTSMPLPTVDSNARTNAIPATAADNTGGNTGTNTGVTDTSGFWSTLWEWLKKIYDAICSIPSAIRAIPKAISDALDLNVPDDISFDFTPLQVVTDKFPFCIPWDMINIFRGFKADRVAPKWEIKFPSLSWGSYGTMQEGSFEIDLGKPEFAKVAAVLRYFLLVIFVYGLIIKTRPLIRG